MSEPFVFHTADSMVMLPRTTPILVPAAKARDAVARDRNIRRSHLGPLFDAAGSFACPLLIVVQGCDPFTVPSSPWIITIGDDLHFAWGPDAFDKQSLNTAMVAAEHCVLITSGPDPYPYRVAATMAAKHRRNVLLIESQPYQHDAWQQRIDKAREGKPIPTFCSMPEPASA